MRSKQFPIFSFDVVCDICELMDRVIYGIRDIKDQ